MHSPSWKWPRSSIEKPQPRRCEPLKGLGAKFLRNTRFAEKHSKTGLRKMQANNAKAMRAGAEAVRPL
ncbi:hypothetical protein E2I00_018363 [Balaenoptera physalus]|uniref:Large ribosomal subunit protein eL29 n=1 Tax=Balaenoptera physalus TaxID=9770 RepID=A0A6A1QGJ5_BALPH|nr:hypothetical protein E2I00_018363 [Balaenoptera physalus]